MEAGKNKRPEFLNPDNSYTLLYPVKYSIGEEQKLIEKLQLRRITGAERMLMDEPIGYTLKVLKVLAAVTGEMVEVLKKIDSVDIDRLDECLGYFMQPGHPIGAIS